MPVKLKGTKELIKALERKFGQSAMESFSRKGHKKAAEFFLKELKAELQRIKGPYRTGATEEEATLEGPVRKGNEYVFTIRWKGPDHRYRLIHINEWGTVRVPNPPLKGAIARTLKNTEQAYYRYIQNEITKEIRR